MRSRVVPWIAIALLVACGPPAPVTVVGFEPPTSTELAPPPTAIPPPPTTHVGTDDTGRACVIADDCVLVTETCGGIAAANREHAVEVQAGYTALAAVAECERLAAPAPVDPMCDENACGVREASDPDARTCQDDADCEAVPMGCTWAVASRTAPGYARVVEVSRGFAAGAAPPCEIPEVPVLSCRYGYCSRARDLVPVEDH